MTLPLPAQPGQALVVAADGGNSKTDLVLATSDGDVLAKVSGDGTRPHLDGMAATTKALAELVDLARARAGIEPACRISIATFYLANIDLPEEETDAHLALSGLGVADQVRVRNDTFAVLRAGTTRDWGIAVVSGAGINAVGVDPNGREERFLALGDITGDWGGGYSVGLAALGAAVRAADGRGPLTSLREVVADFYGRSPEDVAVAINRDEVAQASVRGLSPHVFAAASTGDSVARGIVIRLADEAVSFALALLRRLDLTDSDAHVILGGGTLQAGQPLLLERIASELHAAAPRSVLRVLGVPPVAGALTDALRLAGASDPAVLRARAALTR